MPFKYKQNAGENVYILAKWPTFWPLFSASKVPKDIQMQTYTYLLPKLSLCNLMGL